MRHGRILLVLLLVIASESWSEEPQSARDFFPRQGVVKFSRCVSGTGPDVRQTYREGARFQDEVATAYVEELISPDGEMDTSVHYYRVLDDRWSLLGSEKSSGNVIVLYEPPITQFRFPLKAGDRWQQDYTQRAIFPGGSERRVQFEAAFAVHGRETITVFGKKYDCWKIAFEIKQDGKRVVSAVSWTAKRYGTVRKTAWYPNGKVIEVELETFRAAGPEDGKPKRPGARPLDSEWNRR